MKNYRADTLKKGFFYLKSEWGNRCYYLSGGKKGNKWIELLEPKPQWCTLTWTCIPDDEDLEECIFSEKNPTEFAF